jgi:hypothetical protein
MNTTIDFSRNSSIPSIGGYDFYIGYLEDIGYQTTLDLHVDADDTTYTEDFVPTSFLDNTPYTPPSIVNDHANSSSSSRLSFLPPVTYAAGSGLVGSLLLLVPLHLL